MGKRQPGFIRGETTQRLKSSQSPSQQPRFYTSRSLINSRNYGADGIPGAAALPLQGHSTHEPPVPHHTAALGPIPFQHLPDSRGIPARPLPQMQGTSHNTPKVSPHPTRSQTPNARSPLPTGSLCCRSPTLHGIHPHTQNPTTQLGRGLPQLSNTNILCAFGSKHSSAGFPRPRAACVSLSPGCMPSPPDKRGQS